MVYLEWSQPMIGRIKAVNQTPIVLMGGGMLKCTAILTVSGLWDWSRRITGVISQTIRMGTRIDSAIRGTTNCQMPAIMQDCVMMWHGSEQAHTIDEVGSTFTIQGFDLNYVGVILGPSVKYRDGRIVFDGSASKNDQATQKRGSYYRLQRSKSTQRIECVTQTWSTWTLSVCG